MYKKWVGYICPTFKERKYKMTNKENLKEINKDTWEYMTNEDNLEEIHNIQRRLEKEDGRFEEYFQELEDGTIEYY